MTNDTARSANRTNPAVMTPKQTLLAHIHDMHPRLAHVNGKWTMAQAATLHAKHHHHFVCNHYHEGANLGPDHRPLGWRTGEDAVPRWRTLG